MSTDSNDFEPAADRIVEVYSAADSFEAHGLCSVLQENGIQSRIVGEELGVAAGCLPLGEAMAPRIWVREGDAARAREIIEEWTSQPHQELSELVESDEKSEEDEEEAEEEDMPPAPGTQFRWLSRCFVIAGTACALLGTTWAWHSWMAMQKYRGTTEGALVGGEPHLYTYIPAPSDKNIPVPREPPSFSIYYDLQYAFSVDGKTYYSIVRDANTAERQIVIHYDPNHPKENVAGPLTSPSTVLVAVLGIGACVSFIGLLLRKRAARFGRECETIGATSH
jgi:hypothetical protein